MDKKRFFRDLYKDDTSGARFYKATDSEEGFYHVCDDFINGKKIMKYMPEIYRHDISTTLYIGNERLSVKYCPICGIKFD